MNWTIAKPRPNAPSPARTAGLERLAWLMDRAFVIPGTRIPIGLDAIIGLLPLGGDVLTGIVQVGIVLVALARYRVPRAVATQMAANVLLDVTVGAVPILGDIFDIAFKANTRNLRLLEPYARAQDGLPAPANAPAPDLIARAGFTPWGCLLAIAIGLIALLMLAFVGFVAVIVWLVRGH